MDSAAIILITGDDEPLIRDSAVKAARHLAGDDADAFSLEVHRESDEKSPDQVIAEFVSSLNTPPFLGGKKTLWLQSFPFPAKEADNPVGQGLKQVAEIIEAGCPADLNLVMDGPGLTDKSKLFSACKAAGRVMMLRKPEMRDRNWSANVSQVLQAGAAEKGLKLHPGVIDYLIEVVGVDTGRIDGELEKIFCYAGTEPTTEQVQAVCRGNREAHFFAFANALGERNLQAVFRTIMQSMENTKNPNQTVVSLLRQGATTMRKLLHARLLMYGLKESANNLHDSIQALSDEDRRPFEHNMLVKMKRGQVYVIAKQAANYEGPELVSAVQSFAAADKSLVSSSVPPRVLLEDLVLRTVRRA
jgi:DNA polymerase III delta subunit